MADHTSDRTQSGQYTLGYGMRLEKGTAPELAHPHVAIARPDGSEGSMALHVINGTPDEIKARFLESVDAFFDIHTSAEPSVVHQGLEH